MSQRSLPLCGGRRRIATTDLWKHLVSTKSGCWEWRGATNDAGYGLVYVSGGGNTMAHRLAFTLSRGIDPGDLFVCHRCDNPPCCNPAHLFLGTQADNMRDAMVKGRIRPYGGRKPPRHRPFTVGLDEYLEALEYAEATEIDTG